MKTIDKDRDYVTVGGRLPLRYMQDGFGFDALGRYLGPTDAQGNLVAEPEPAQGVKQGAAIDAPVLDPVVADAGQLGTAQADKPAPAEADAKQDTKPTTKRRGRKPAPAEADA